MLVLFAVASPAAVRVFIQQSNSLAWVKYECTAGEIVRAFALDVTVDQGQIIAISDFFRGPSSASEQGYGIFPASFRDHLASIPGTNTDWNLSSYTPLAVPADKPADTLPGLESSGVTLEFGGLWDPDALAAIPGSAGTLCALRISKRAMVSLAANSSRGGVVQVDNFLPVVPEFTEAMVQPPEITGLSVTNGLLNITFAGGELEAAPTAEGPWSGTGNTNGQYSELVVGGTKEFYRVRGQ